MGVEVPFLSRSDIMPKSIMRKSLPKYEQVGKNDIVATTNNNNNDVSVLPVKREPIVSFDFGFGEQQQQQQQHQDEKSIILLDPIDKISDGTEARPYASSFNEDEDLVDWLNLLNSDGLFFDKFDTAIMKPEWTSLEVFMSFVKHDQFGNIDCSGILSRECFERWLETRQAKPINAAECFRKSILSKVTRSDGGSAPFPKYIEGPLLMLLRQRRVWPCFQGQLDPITKRPIRIGAKGMRSLGFHERQELEASGEYEGDSRMRKRMKF